MKTMELKGEKQLADALGAAAVLLCLLVLSIIFGGQREVAAGVAPIQQTNGQAFASQLAVKHTTSNFEPSLDMSENADFLLTPALLIQEAVSTQIVLTYPGQ